MLKPLPLLLFSLLMPPILAKEAAPAKAGAPQAIFKVQEHTDCVTIRSGQFPTEKMMTRHGAPPRSRKVRPNSPAR